MHEVRFGSVLTSAFEAFARVVPAANIHHRHATLVVFIRSARVLLGGRLHALLSNFEMHARAVYQFLAGPLHDFLEFLFGASKLLLVKQAQSLVVNLHLRLDARVYHFNSAALGRRWRW